MPSPTRAAILVLLLALPLEAGGNPAARGDDAVVAVVACDGYAEIKRQLGWVGERVGNPQLPALAESFVMMATQFKGLAGLDVNRPLGLVVTAAGDTPVIHGYVPVKDLDRLLATLQGVLGPVERAGGRRLVQVPGGPPLEIEERDGWAIIAVRGGRPGPADPARLLARVTDTFSIGGQVFPSAMPEGMRTQVREALERAARDAAPGQPVDATGLAATIENLAATESLTFGLAVDTTAGAVFLENRTVMLAGSPEARAWADAARAANALNLPAAADGRPVTIRAHHAQAVPAAARPAIEAALDVALKSDDGDAVTAAVFGLVRDLATAMLDSGGLDAGLAVDTSRVEAAALVPALTLAARVKDGPALERKVKDRFADDRSLPPGTTIRFDAGRERGANLHEIRIDTAGLPGAEQLGDAIEATLAVTADRAFLLVGGDVRGRLAAALAAGGAADPRAEPLTGIDVSVPGMMAYAATVAAASGDKAVGDVLATVATKAAAKPSARVQVIVRPIERGVVMRVAGDAGAIEAIADAVTRQAGGGQRPGRAGLPLPLEATP